VDEIEILGLNQELADGTGPSWRVGSYPAALKPPRLFDFRKSRHRNDFKRVTVRKIPHELPGDIGKRPIVGVSNKSDAHLAMAEPRARRDGFAPYRRVNALLSFPVDQPILHLIAPDPVAVLVLQVLRRFLQYLAGDRSRS